MNEFASPSIPRGKHYFSRASLRPLLQACFCFGILLASFETIAQTPISGVITNSQTWSNLVTISGDISIETNAVVTIQPGTIVRAAAKTDDRNGGLITNRTEIIINGGRLFAAGSSNAPILFTSSATNGARDDWFGIRFRSGGLVLKHAVVQFGQDGLYLERGGEITVADSTFRDHYEHGLYIIPATSFEFTNCTFRDNPRGQGVRVVGASTLRFTGCIFENNDDGIECAVNGAQLTATNCQFINNLQYGLNLVGSQSQAALYSSRVAGNGGVGVNGSGPMRIEDCEISKNGGRGLFASSLVMHRSVVASNRTEGAWITAGAEIIGGLISSNGTIGLELGSSPAQLKDLVVERNGKGIHLDTTMQMENCAVRSNREEGLYGTVSGGVTSGSATITNSIFQNNGGLAISIDQALVQSSQLSNNRGGISARVAGLTGSTLSGHSEYGLRLTGSTLTNGIRGNIFRGNTVGVRIEGAQLSFVSLSENDFIDNGIAVENRGAGAVAANSNYWGEQTTAELKSGSLNLSRIYDSRDSRAVGQVFIANFLTNSFATPAITPEARPLFATGDRTVSGVLAASQTWSGTIFLAGDVTINEGVTLTVLPGTRVLADPVADNQTGGYDPTRIELIVNGGRLTAIGQSNAPIAFSSLTNGARADWFGVRFLRGGLTLKHAVVEFGDDGLNLEGGGETVVSDSVFRMNRAHGVTCTANGVFAFLNCLFQGNGRDGLHVWSPSTWQLTGCIFQENEDGIESTIAGASITCQKSLFYRNSRYGLGVTSGGVSHVNLESCEIVENGNTGLYNLSSGTTRIDDSESILNGGLGVYARTVTMNGTVVASNRTDGISITAGGQISGGIISSNGGSGLVVSGGAVQLKDVAIERNSVKGVRMSAAATLEIENATFRLNDEEALFGGTIANVSATITNSIFSNNGGVAISLDRALVQNSIITNNRGGINARLAGLTGSLLSANTDYGVRLTDSILTNGLQGNLIRGSSAGIRLETSKNVEFSNNDFIDNGLAVDNRGAGAVTANNNYWGELTTTELKAGVVNLSRIYDRRDNSASGLVTISTFAEGPLHPPARIITGPQPATVALQGVATFTVVADGKAPLSFQWMFNGLSLTDSARVQGSRSNVLTISGVTAADTGSYSVLVKNQYGQVVSEAAALTVAASNLPPTAQISSPAPNTVYSNAPATILIQASASDPDGTVNKVEFFQGASKLGESSSAPYTFTWVNVSAGTFEISARATDNKGLSASSPVVTVIVQTNTATAGLEADLSPRPNGDNRLSAADFTLAGRLVSGLTTVSNAGEFARADSAPRSTLGDGRLTAADWTQAGRYAAGLDSPRSVGGPVAPLQLAGVLERQAIRGTAQNRVLRMKTGTATLGETIRVPVELSALGNENTIGFSIQFDPAAFLFTSLSNGLGVPAGASVIINTNQLSSGRIGVLIGLPAGASFSAGDIQLASVQGVLLAAPNGETALAFVDQPVFREVVSAEADVLAAEFLGAKITTANPKRALEAPRVAGSVGATVSFPVSFTALGNENTLGFSLEFNPALVRLLSSVPGDGLAAGAQTILNTNHLAQGKLGALIALPAGQTFTATNHPLLRLTFSLISAGLTAVEFSDTPVFREIVGVEADVLEGMFRGGEIQIASVPTALSIQKQPQPAIAQAGTSATFMVEVEGADLKYQWFFNGERLANAVESRLVIPRVTMSNQGRYQVEISNALTNIRSTEVTLTVLPAPSLILDCMAAITIVGQTGLLYQIEFANAISAPTVWKPLSTIQLTNSSQIYLDLESIGQEQRFYRLSVPGQP